MTLLAQGDLHTAPRLILWAWERPEDLRFIDPQTTGVAFLVAEVHLVGDQVRVRPRRQPLRVPESTWRMAVIRLETRGARLDAAQRREVLKHLRPFLNIPGVRAYQVDFDAKDSERPFYQALLQDVRNTMAPRAPLSITALASWCLGDPWIRKLPVDECVPMYFQMGQGAAEVRRWFASGKTVSVAKAKSSLGLSTDEAPPCSLGNHRVYVFSPKPWTQERYAHFRERHLR